MSCPATGLDGTRRARRPLARLFGVAPSLAVAGPRQQSLDERRRQPGEEVQVPDVLRVAQGDQR
eukprot:9466793-Pyramimonas_sp.AAC.1